MPRKQTAILMLFIAYAILLGHNNFPHHHHDTEQELVHHYQNHHQNESDQKDGDLSHHLSHFIHPFDDYTFPTKHDHSPTFSRQVHSSVAVLPDHFFFTKFATRQFPFSIPREHLYYLSSHSPSSGLRAPPAFIA